MARKMKLGKSGKWKEEVDCREQRIILVNLEEGQQGPS
jgi:hypothetical protein